MTLCSDHQVAAVSPLSVLSEQVSQRPRKEARPALQFLVLKELKLCSMEILFRALTHPESSAVCGLHPLSTSVLITLTLAFTSLITYVLCECSQFGFTDFAHLNPFWKALNSLY